jgi:MFS family permease
MSAVGTALGPSLGGILIAAFGWRSIFLVNVPLGLAALLLVRRFVRRERGHEAPRQRFDLSGTLLLALTLAAYALAMTLGRGQFGTLNIALLAAAACGAGLFVVAQQRAPSPLLRLAMFRDRGLSAGFAMSALVTTVMMTTLVVGPFYLARTLGLDAALVGLTMSAGPLVAALSGVPSGRVVDQFGARRMTITGLMAMAAGALLLSAVPARYGVPGYVGGLVILTAGYALFQAANNTAVMTGIGADQRGVISGLLNLARNLGLITGASAMGAVFAFAAGATDIAAASPEAVAAAMRVTFAVAAVLIGFAVAVAFGGRARRTVVTTPS